MDNVTDKPINQLTAPPIIYKYACFGILLSNVMTIPIYGLAIWLLITSGPVTLKLGFGYLFVIFWGVMNLRALLRLRETVIVIKDEVNRKTSSSETYISWNDIACVKVYWSWLERRCYKIESINGDYITISEMLDGYVELYKTLEHNVPSSKFIK
jgi:hypothetical protein